MNIYSDLATLDAELNAVDFEQGGIEQSFDRARYNAFTIHTMAATGTRYAYVVVSFDAHYDRKGVLHTTDTLGMFGGAIRHYLYRSAKFGGPIKGRKIVNGTRNAAKVVHYIIDNPFYNA